MPTNPDLANNFFPPACKLGDSPWLQCCGMVWVERPYPSWCRIRRIALVRDLMKRPFDRPPSIFNHETASWALIGWHARPRGAEDTAWPRMQPRIRLKTLKTMFLRPHVSKRDLKRTIFSWALRGFGGCSSHTGISQCTRKMHCNFEKEFYSEEAKQAMFCFVFSCGNP